MKIYIVIHVLYVFIYISLIPMWRCTLRFSDVHRLKEEHVRWEWPNKCSETSAKKFSPISGSWALLSRVLTRAVGSVCRMSYTCPKSHSLSLLRIRIFEFEQSNHWWLIFWPWGWQDVTTDQRERWIGSFSCRRTKAQVGMETKMKYVWITISHINDIIRARISLRDVGLSWMGAWWIEDLPNMAWKWLSQCGWKLANNFHTAEAWWRASLDVGGGRNRFHFVLKKHQAEYCRRLLWNDRFRIV